jgi:hypothetical protein
MAALPASGNRLNYPCLAGHDWFLDGLRDEPQFQALLEKVRIASAELECL